MLYYNLKCEISHTKQMWTTIHLLLSHSTSSSLTLSLHPLSPSSSSLRNFSVDFRWLGMVIYSNHKLSCKLYHKGAVFDLNDLISVSLAYMALAVYVLQPVPFISALRIHCWKSFQFFKEPMPVESNQVDFRHEFELTNTI